MPSAFLIEYANDLVEDWVSRLDQSCVFFTWTTGRPVPVEPVSMKNVILVLDNWENVIKCTKVDSTERRTSIASGDF